MKYPSQYDDGLILLIRRRSAITRNLRKTRRAPRHGTEEAEQAATRSVRVARRFIAVEFPLTG